MSVEIEKVPELILRSRVTIRSCLLARLYRGISSAQIAKITSDDAKRLHYLLVAEATSARFRKLRSQGKIGESKTILEKLSLLEEELGGRLYDDDLV